MHLILMQIRIPMVDVAVVCAIIKDFSPLLWKKVCCSSCCCCCWWRMTFLSSSSSNRLRMKQPQISDNYSSWKCPGVNFTNILLAAFLCADPKSAKRHWWPNCLFALLGSAQSKAACKTLIKFTPGINPTKQSVSSFLFYFWY